MLIPHGTILLENEDQLSIIVDTEYFESVHPLFSP